MTENPDAADLIIDQVLMDLVETYSGFDDTGEAIFGGRARIEEHSDHLIVCHETADGPAVQITVERIA